MGNSFFVITNKKGFDKNINNISVLLSKYCSLTLYSGKATSEKSRFNFFYSLNYFKILYNRTRRTPIYYVQCFQNIIAF